MKFNFKLFLAGAFIPVGITATLFSSVPNTDSSQNNSPISRPYIVDEISTSGENMTTFVGQSSSLDPFTISTDIGAAPYKEDKFTAFPDVKMGIGSKITLYRAPSYTIVDGKKTYVARSWTKTVGELLAERNTEIGDDDKINFAKDFELIDKMEIRIIRVALTNLRIPQKVDYKVVKKEDNTLDKGKINITQKGQSGEKILTYQLRREDGVEVSRKLILTELTKEPVEEIQIIGTKPVITGWCRYNDIVMAASIKNGLDPDRLCSLMRKESNGHADSVSGGGHLGLFQYTEGFWADASAKAGYAGASWMDPTAQIYTTAWAVTHGYASRWSGTFK